MIAPKILDKITKIQKKFKIEKYKKITKLKIQKNYKIENTKKLEKL